MCIHALALYQAIQFFLLIFFLLPATLTSCFMWNLHPWQEQLHPAYYFIFKWFSFLFLSFSSWYILTHRENTDTQKQRQYDCIIKSHNTMIIMGGRIEIQRPHAQQQHQQQQVKKTFAEAHIILYNLRQRTIHDAQNVLFCLCRGRSQPKEREKNNHSYRLYISERQLDQWIVNKGHKRKRKNITHCYYTQPHVHVMSAYVCVWIYTQDLWFQLSWMRYMRVTWNDDIGKE